MKGRINGWGGVVACVAVFVWPEIHVSAATVARWDFNSMPADGSVATGRTMPAIGAGAARVIGGVSESFATGGGTDPGSDNSAWSTSGYPPVGGGNRTAGVEFRLSTRGYSNLVLSWEQRVTGSASRYWRLQYATNGVDFSDGSLLTLRTNNTFLRQSIVLSGIRGADNNTNLAFRIVAEFESTAIGTGVAGYVTPLGAAYSASGSARFDFVQIDGAALRPDNAPPVIQAIAAQETLEDQALANLPVEVTDDASASHEIRLEGSSSDPSLIPDAQIVVNGTGRTRFLTITPQAGRYGQATITLTARDAENLSSTASFMVTVRPRNFPPQISEISRQHRVVGETSAPIRFTVSDVETALGSLQVSATSSNPDLLSPAGLRLGGAGGDRTLDVQPSPGQVGSTLINVRVLDAGGRSAATQFVLMILPSPTGLLDETFGYPAGSLVVSSGGGWSTHTGTTGQVQVADHGIVLGSNLSEDIHAGWPGGPIEHGSIYLAFDLMFTALPGNLEYFAHLNHASGFRARLYAGTNNAARGAFRLSAGNGGNAGIGQAPQDLALNHPYTVVLRYDTEVARTALWINPVNESSPAALATDDAAVVPIQSIALRNNAGIGAMKLSGLRLGRAFTDVVRSPGWTLAIQPEGDSIGVSWPAEASGYRLQVNSNPSAAGWVNEPTPATSVGSRWAVRLPKTGQQRFFRLAR